MPEKLQTRLPRRELLRKALIGVAAISWASAGAGTVALAADEIYLLDFKMKYPDSAMPLSLHEVSDIFDSRNILNKSEIIGFGGAALGAASLVARRFLTSPQRELTNQVPPRTIQNK